MTIRPITPASGRFFTALVLISALALGGCGFYKKMQANKKNGEVEALLQQAQAQEANRYVPDLFTNANKALNDARGAVNSGNYDEALTAGDNAKALAEQINSRLPQAKAVIQQKRTNLAGLQNRINGIVQQIKSVAPDETAILDRATALDGQITQLQQAAVQVSEGDQGYDAHLQTAKAFLTEATTSLAKIEEDRSKKLVSEVETAWSHANEFDVLKYVADSRRIPDVIEQAKALIQAASYRAVLTRFASLKDEIGRFQETARSERARARIEQAERLIKLAEAEPGASLDKIDAAKASLDEAATQLQQGNYDSAYTSAENGINTARGEVKTLENEIKGQVDQIEKRVEESLKWNTSKISAQQYGEALAQLNKAKEQLAAILFSEAQETLDSGSQIIEEAISQARSIGLAIRIREDESALLATESRGSYQYLPEDYQAVQGLLADASGQVNIASYDEAEATLAKAEQSTSGLEGGLRKLAQEHLAAAEAAFKEAVDSGAKENASDILGEALESIDKARDSAATSQWKQAIENSGSARTKAQTAAQQSYRIRSDSLRPEADKELQNARLAGAASYAAEIYNKALDSFEKSRQAYQTQDFRTSLNELQAALDGALHARRHQIERAQEAVESAIEAKAPDFDKDNIGSALSDIAEAKEKMEQTQFGPSRELAQSAEQKARTSETRTWNLRSTASIAELKDQLAKAESSRAPTYAEAEFKQASLTLSKAEASFAGQKFKEACEQAEAGKTEAQKVFAKLADEAQLVRGEYDTLVGQLKSFVQDEFGIGLHSEATKRLGAIDEAILQNDLNRVFGLYEEGMDTTQKQIVATKLHNINGQKENLANQIGGAEKAGLFQFSEVTTDSLRGELAKLDYDPALDRLKPEADIYRQGLRALAKVEAELAHLQDAALTNIDTRVQKVRTDIDNAREIGARDLVPGTFDAAVDAYEKARDMVYLRRNNLAGGEAVDFLKLGEQLRSAESQASLLNQTAIARRNSVDYMRDLILWTYDMTRFVDQWYPIEQLGMQMILTSDPTSQVDSYKEFQSGISARQLLTEAGRLHDRIRLVTPPADQATLHEQAVQSFAAFVATADSFHRYGLYSRYPKRMRQRFLADGFASLERLHQLNDRLLTGILKQIKAYNLQDFERDLSEELTAFTTYLRREKAAG
jgi:hypothetical protein